MSRQSYYHVFSLPQELLDNLILRENAHHPSTESAQRSETPLPPSERPATNSRSCNICLAATFSDVDEQRSHFRSDWHRYNVKIRLNGGNPVGEAQFAQLVDGLDDSLSGSASSTDDESEDSDAVATLVDKTRKLGRSPSPDSEPIRGPQTALAWFHSPPSTQIGVYKFIFSRHAPSTTYVEELKELQKPVGAGRTWALFMTAGGHFAGAIVRVGRPEGHDSQPEYTKKGKAKKQIPDVEILKHKTFHRYTTRRKQGGSQSLNDNAKSKAVSAGAMLRRYGEQALRDDIRNLLTEWEEDIADCERIWIRASVSNRKIFVDYEGSVLTKDDDRLRTFPFPTRRPTQSELSRCLLELTRVKSTHLTEEALREEDEAYLASLPKPKSKPISTQPPPDASKPKTVPQKFTPEEEALRDRWTRALGIIQKGRLDALKAFWIREGENLGGVNALVPDWTGQKGGTILQVAAQSGQEEVTRWLLEDLRANPTTELPTDRGGSIEDDKDRESDDEDARAPATSGSRRTAYDIARTKAVRNVFRRCAANHPDWWDWLGTEQGARVPSILTQEMEDERDTKKKARRKGLKDRLKERENKEKEREATRTPSPPPPPAPVPQKKADPAVNGPRKLGGSSGASEGVAGLTPEMRARIERERRARAAEARMQGGKR